MILLGKRLCIWFTNFGVIGGRSVDCLCLIRHLMCVCAGEIGHKQKSDKATYELEQVCVYSSMNVNDCL